MNTVLIPPTARTDVRPEAEPAATGLGPVAVRLAGVAIVALTGVFVGTMILPWPQGADRSIPSEFGGLALLVALGVLVLLAWRSRGSGAGAWRPLTALAGLGIALALAIQVAAMIQPGGPFAQLPWLLAAGAAILVGVGIVAAGRWRGLARYLPLAAHVWVFAVFAAVTTQTDEVAWSVFLVAVVAGQATLGIALAVAPRTVTGTAVREVTR